MDSIWRVPCYFAIGLIAAFGAQVPLQAADVSATEAALLKSMRERLPELMKLKLNGKVGENNDALIEVRTALAREKRRLVREENSDRLAYYKLIAEKLGVSVAAVQRNRAEQIRSNTPPGVWIEPKTGDWYQKE